MFGLGLRPADLVLMASLLFFSILTVLFPAPFPHPWAQLLQNAAVGVVFLGMVLVHQRASSRALRFWVRLLSFQMMFAYVFPLVAPFQLIISKAWNDPAVLRAEQAVFGVQPLIWIQPLVSPPLTEWLMFAYVAYLPLYPVLCGLLYFKRGELHMEDLVFTMAVANLACAAGFILYPVAGPLFAIADRFTVPLRGHLFASLGEYVREHFQSIGSSLPSPHCAVATIMIATAFRRLRTAFYILAPILFSIFLAAFYGRFHYLSDVVLGILTGAAVLLVLPRLTASRSARALPNG